MSGTRKGSVPFDVIKRTVPLTALLERFGVLSQLKRSGRQLVGCCPIHKGTNKKQFVVDPDKHLWTCFGDCRAGGSTLEFVAAMENVGITEAAERIVEWFALATPRRQMQRQQRRKTVSEDNRPTHRVFSAKKREGQKDWLTEIGSAWLFSYADDKKTGVNIQLTALPVGDRIVLFENDAEDPQKSDASDKKPDTKKRK